MGGRRWTAAEDTAIRHAVATRRNRGGLAAVAQQFGRTVCAVRARARRIGAPSKVRWSAAEDREIRSAMAIVAGQMLAIGIRHGRMAHEVWARALTLARRR